DSGKHMLAHELTHVVQQRSGPVEGTDNGGGVKVSNPSDRFEREAVATADRVMSAPAPVQRCEDHGSHSGGEMAVQREEAPAEEETAQTFVQRAEEEEEAPAE
ncbi:eCIS core domain-containing protein, partial [Lentzea sp.]|uniref:eCIS core domain-containing protein n=1 Tax=Lentzea sp. TaxID=56099 RepID=UPI002ED6AE3F